MAVASSECEWDVNSWLVYLQFLMIEGQDLVSDASGKAHSTALARHISCQ